MLKLGTSIASLVSLFFLGAIFVDELPANDEQQRKELWRQVQQAEKQSLPKSAVAALQQIYDSAVADQDYPEAIRARSKKYIIEGQINQPATPYVIRNLTSDMDGFPEQVRPVMKVLLANWFFTYYSQNRWRFAQRSQTGQAPSEDFETWDLKQLLSKVDELFTDALASSDALKQIPVTDYDDILQSGTVSDLHRPTLFDFVAFQALDFYSLDEQVVRKQGAFDLRADSPVFASTDQFLAWQPNSEDDETSYLLRAIKIYQELLQFHAEDEDPTARLDADLHRLTFGIRASVGDEKDARYRSALQRFADQHADHQLSARALSSLAGSWFQDGELVKAHQIANQGMTRFPNSVGGRICFNLIGRIEQKELGVQAERVWNEAKPVIEVKYRNIDRVHFRLIEYDFQNPDWGRYPNPAYLPQSLRKKLLRKPAIKQWTHELPETDDYRQRVEAVPAMTDLKPGCYMLVASVYKDVKDEKNIVSLCEVWRSDLSVLVRNARGDLNVSGHVVDAITGEPVVGARVEVAGWSRQGRNSSEVKLPQTQTDANGYFAVPGRTRSQHQVLIRHQDQVFGYIDGNYKYGQQNRNAKGSRTLFFTDRSIYRPGQSIQFKAVSIFYDHATNDYRVMANGGAVAVNFMDVNQQVIETKNFQTNEFGSFSGSFVAPTDRATGRMYLRSPGANASFRVEEYKRPKFFVELEKPDQAFRLQEQVAVTGRAKSYTGAPIDGAKVKWRVVRKVRYPDWWLWRCFWFQPQRNDSQEIAHGESETGVDGTFQVDFEALPDLDVDRESEPVFTYSIYADVTDTTGETRSDTEFVRIGYTSLQSSLQCEDWQTDDQPVKIAINVSTLDGEGQQADGTLKIYALRSPEKMQRAELNSWNRSYGSNESTKPDLSKINAWPLADVVEEKQVSTAGDGKLETEWKLKPGAYRAVFETKDKSGQAVKSEVSIMVVDIDGKEFVTKVPHYFQPKSLTVEVGEQFEAFWGSGYGTGRAFVEIEHRGKKINSYWTEAGNTQTHIKHDVSEKYRGGFTVRLTFVRDNRAYIEKHRVNVPWSNKKLQIKWEHFVSKLTPGGRETWTAIVSGPDAVKATAEMVATLYDSSLDAYAKHQWSGNFNVFYQDYSTWDLAFQNALQPMQSVVFGLQPRSKSANIRYRRFNNGMPSIQYGNFLSSFDGSATRGGRSGGGGFGGGFGSGGRVVGDFATSSLAKSNTFGAPESVAEADAYSETEAAPQGKDGSSGAAEGGSDVDLSKVAIRKNLQETAFFFPNLTVDGDGKIRIEFEVPEALTEWKFIGFAHDKDLRTALLEDQAVTSKDLMVQPNPPRFLREGDQLEFSVKVSNRSATRQAGKVRLSFSDARTEEVVDQLLSNQELDKLFDIPAGESRSLFWKLAMPDYVGVLKYKAVGGTDRISDGEEGMLPVLSKRILVTESLPLPIRGNQAKDFQFDRLQQAGQSDSLQSQTLTVQMTSNPAWYAILSLPYLMEYPHGCSEQVFNRLYANSLGRHIATSNPRIKQVFDQWRGTDALDSPLEKNEDIRNVLIAESPWLRAGKKESQARRDVAILFDNNRLDAEIRKSLNRLKQMQYSDGSWPWFPGGRANDYITLYVVTGFGRLRHLGVAKVDVSPAVQALDRLDNWIHNLHQRILEDGKPDENHLTPMVCKYLYGRSFFLTDSPINDKYRAAVDYFRNQAKKYWPAVGNRQSQGHLAIGLKRFGDQQTPKQIMASLTERSQRDEELGMFWREDGASWWWYRAPIETQALMIEAYDEVMGDSESMEECKIWMLKQKQTQNWKTTKATADAVYSLLLRGTSQLSSNKLVEVSIGGNKLEPDKVEAGTGFFEKRFVRGEIVPEMGQIKVAKSDAGIAWGSVHWQYLEDVSKIEPYEGTPLTLKKSLYIKKNTDTGPVIEPVSGPVQVGDQLVTRVELRVDRDMEYVHLKDYRGSGTEPVNVLSQYKFQDGLAYYESTRDTASHFFIDYLPRGTHVFEYSVRVQHKGSYETGIAELQCMYAPEFNSHSGSVAIKVK